MKKIFHILLVVLLPFFGSSQNFTPEEKYELDSLNKILSNPSSHDTSIADSYIRISTLLGHNNKDTVEILCKKSIQIAKNALLNKPNKKILYALNTTLASAYNSLGQFYSGNNNDSLALLYYEKGLTIVEKINNLEGVAALNGNIGVIYSNQGNKKKALFHFQKSIFLLENEVDDKTGLAYNYVNISLIHEHLGGYEISLKYLKKALKICDEIGNKRGSSVVLNNIGTNYLNHNQDSLALIYFYQAEKLQKQINDQYYLSTTYNNIGTIYGKKGLHEKSLEYHNNALLIRESINYKEGIAYSLRNIGSEYYSLGKFEKSKEYGLRGLKIAKEVGYPFIIKGSAELLYKIELKLGNYKESLKMYKLHIQMRDSLNNEATQKAAATQQAKYEYEKQKAVDDAEHEKQIAIEQEAKAKQKVITYATASGLGLVVIFLVFVFNRLQVTKKQKIVIETQKQEVERQKEVVELAHHELEEKNQEILDSITYAKRIQNAILPPLKVVKEYLQESFILYKPKDIVAGDFYWLEHKDGKVLFAAADCTGHGVPGAMVSVVCNNGLNRSVREYGLTDPGEILNKTREIVIAEFEKSEDEVKDGMDIALCSLEGNVLKYAGANNPLWIIRQGVNEIEEIKADKQPIGKYAEPKPYTTHTIELQKGDSIYIFSDGYADQFGGEKGKKFKAANFKQLLLSIQNETIEKQKQLIDEAFEKWKGELEQLDDVCVIGVKI